MNTDSQKSAQPCGCDEGANHVCEMHQTHVTRALNSARLIREDLARHDQIIAAHPADQKQWRKERPLYSGVLNYFPDALMEVAHVSFLGNEQHNPGQPLHWAREKSTDHLDCVARHTTDHGRNPLDTDGGYHLAKAAWRALAELQMYLETKGRA